MQCCVSGPKAPANVGTTELARTANEFVFIQAKSRRIQKGAPLFSESVFRTSILFKIANLEQINFIKP